MLLSSNHCSCPCHHHNLPCMFVYFPFLNNNKSINTFDHSGFHTFTILRIIWSCESCQSLFDFTMDTILLIFAVINGPLIFISCMCTIINNFITLYFWCQCHFSKTSVSTATQVTLSPRVINLEISCHLEVVNEVSFSTFLNFLLSCFHSYTSTMASGFPKMHHDSLCVYMKGMC